MENRADYLIESLFANTLTGAEAQELKSLAATNPAVANEIAFQRRIAAAVAPLSLSHSIQNPVWKEAAQKPFPAAIKVTMWPRYAYAAAAVVALLIAAFLFFQDPSLQSVVAENTKEYPNLMKFKSLGGEAETISPEVLKAFELYDSKNYGEAAKALQPIVSAQPERMDYRFYWGVSLVKEKRFAEAVAALTEVAQSADEKRIPALYYLGLACAGNGDKSCAQANLRAYIDSREGVTYRKQAQAVLDAL